jgi:hypothetical protein
MASVSQDALTLMEIANMRGPDGNFLTIAEVLTTMEEFWEGARWINANGDMTHHWSSRGNEPAGTWTRYNKGVQKSLSSTIPGKDELAMLEDYSYVDDRLLRNAAANNKELVRSRQDAAFVAGMSKEAISKIFYGNRSSDVDTITGLANMPGKTALSAANFVYNGGGTATGGVQSSIWAIEWGPQKVTLTHPPGNPTSMVQTEDLGKQLINDSDGNPYTAWVTHFFFVLGISMIDPQAAIRIANVPDSTTLTIPVNMAVKAVNWLPSTGRDAYLYMNRYARANFLIYAKDLTNVHYLGSDPNANPFNRKFITSFMQVPIHVTESLLQTEAKMA